ncbi:MAG: bifunctional diaminohydroxyphosphoribosylaminopyrimidine deaminase/5-amino-6-(5-phosphoribosylamino)uracil reductase RibD [Eubacteriaceae bacterium]
MHQEYMRHAIALSKKGIGYTNPNPLVGALIVKNNHVIGKGYHEFYGGPHAEINALNNASQDTTGATMYVTLEPCSHYGKTPPCTETIIKNKISKVVIGMIDPNPMVAGKGIQRLKDAGIEVVTGILEKEIQKLNEIFIKYILTKTPFCIMKSAMTMDGKISTSTGESKWITGEKSRQYVHEIRHHVTSIMVGIGTILSDNPTLNTRLSNKQGLDPIRIIVDTYGRIPLNSKVIVNQSKSKTILATTEKASENKLINLKSMGVEIIITPLKDNRVDLIYLMKKLGSMGIDSILLEGGSELNFSAIKDQIVDKLITFIAPKIIGGKTAKTPVGGLGINSLTDAFHLKDIHINRLDEDILIESYIKR